MPGRGAADSGLRPPPTSSGNDCAPSRSDDGGLVCISATAAAEGLPPERACGARRDRRGPRRAGSTSWQAALVLAGYERVERVEERGQIAIRGGILDVFGTGREPIRVELFDVVEGVRAFSPFTQRVARAGCAVIFPASERRADLAENEALDRGDNGALARQADLAWRPATCSRSGGTSSASIWKRTAPSSTRFPVQELASARSGQPRRAGHGRGRARANALVRLALEVGPSPPWRRPAHAAPAEARGCLMRRAWNAAAPAGRSSSPLRRRGSSGAILRSPSCPTRRCSGGGRHARPVWRGHCGRSPTSARRTTSSTRTAGSASCVGFETQTVGGITRDYLQARVRGEDRLYVPYQVGASRYVGADGGHLTLSKLGGRAWQLVKSRAGHAARELAGELLALYAQREHAAGVAFDLANDWLERSRSVVPVPRDAGSARGDRGEEGPSLRARWTGRRRRRRFGKTEVAVRAAFAVALNGRQTFVLAPTTILKQQHWNDVRERYTDFPIVCEMVSRFRSPADVKRALADFCCREGGRPHRDASRPQRDVVPSDLGLVVVDEEQRFGVAQKELLRQLRLEVDVLSLSATPIPRTLHMSSRASATSR